MLSKRDYQRKTCVEEVIGLSLPRLQKLGVIRRWVPAQGELKCTVPAPYPYGWISAGPPAEILVGYKISWYPDVELNLDVDGWITVVRLSTTLVHIKNNPTRRAERLWFTCPHCSRRVGRLFFFPYHTKIACRKCHDLTYRSIQNRRRRIEVFTQVFRGVERIMDNRRRLRDRFHWALKLKQLQHRLDGIAKPDSGLGSLD